MIEEKAKDLGRVIGQSPEYQAMKRANDALAGDSEAVALLQEMETIRLDAQRMIQRGERPSEEMETRLEELLAKVQVNSTYQRLVVAQENYDKLMMRVNDLIVEGIKKGATSSIITLG
ncbi:MAG TPA: YlbF family regulator [Gemmatimonadaceae bacterium]|nr:YlbF family regulator [Gemmatimonadaceae bacterium]